MQNTQQKTKDKNNIALLIAWILLCAFMLIALLFFTNGAIGSSAVPGGSVFL